NSARFGGGESWRHNRQGEGFPPLAGTALRAADIRRAWVQTEGNRVTFHDHNVTTSRNRTYFYYARVTTPGTFTAEGTLVQSQGAREYMAVGQNQVITIE
ncbi:MAG: hypothetical protein FWC08_12460, partial [Defluviitaleaceae bacterium]|nr:hypothetical protein [Defluviitaleaceae bacterium]